MRLGGDTLGSYGPAGENRERPGDGPALLENPLVCGLFLIILLFLGGVAFLSVSAVPPLHFAIRYNQFSKGAATGAIYKPGRYIIGPFNRFLLFPSTVQTIEFASDPRIAPSGVRYEPLHTRTKEGLGLHLQVSLQYRLTMDNLGKLYEEFNQNYEQVFISSVRDVLIKAASEYEATQLWEQRASIGDKMQRMVDKELRKTFAGCWGLQLMVIDLPDQFESSIVRTQVQKQSLLKREQEQRSAQIRAETTVIRAEYDRRVKVILSAGIANYTVTKKTAEAEAQGRRIEMQSKVILTLKKNLGIGAEGLVTYQKYDAVDDMEYASIFYGFGDTSQVLVQPRSGTDL